MLREGAVEEHEDNVVKPRTKPKKLVPLLPGVEIIDSLDAHDDEDLKASQVNGVSDSGMAMAARAMT